METSELFYPEINARIGDYSFNKGVEVEIYSSADSYFDWAKLRFTRQFQDKINLNQKDKAVIELGYNEVFDEVFVGHVVKPYSGGSFANEIILKDDMIFLEETYITNTFLDVIPQEIIRFCLNKAGITEARISPKVYPKKKVVPVFRKNVIGVIEEVHSIWGIKEQFFFSAGVFYWGEKPEQNKLYEFEYGVNIIALDRPGGVWELETVSMPFVRHSQKIVVRHPKISGVFETKKVVFTTNDAGFIRTYIYF